MNFLYSMVSFCVTIGIVVTAHELGHYLAARWCGVGVETFSIGFGRPIVGWYDRSGTFWKIGWIPLGGYVKMYNLEGQRLLSRTLVILAGPIANCLLAMVLITSLFMVNGVPVSQPIVGYVAPDSPAAHAGLLSRDQIVSFDNLPITSFEQLRAIIDDRPGKTVPITIERGGTQQHLQATLGASAGSGMLGIMPANEISPTRALIVGPLITAWMIKATIVGVFQIGTTELSGPVGIAQASGEAVHQGWATWVWLLTMLSVSLGVLNMIPLPVLDGGRLIYYLFEAILGRPLSQTIQSIGLAASSLLLLGLFVFVTWHDISRWLFG